MSQAIEIKVPDIGDYDAVPVIEVHVKPGDTINAEDALVTLESDKATMDVPSPQAGTVKEVRIKVGDNVAEGSVLVMLEPAGAGAAAPAPAPAAAPAPAPAAAPALHPRPLPQRPRRPRRLLAEAVAVSWKSRCRTSATTTPCR